MKLLLLCLAITACSNGIPTSQQTTLRNIHKPKAAPAQVKAEPAMPAHKETPASSQPMSYVP
ncbi:MAG: hypothetical protein ACM31C_10870 [Acidobacteriota bacterium]